MDVIGGNTPFFFNLWWINRFYGLNRLDGFGSRLNRLDGFGSRLNRLDGLRSRLNRLDGLGSRLNWLDGFGRRLNRIDGLRIGLNRLDGLRIGLNRLNWFRSRFDRLDGFGRRLNWLDGFRSRLNRLDGLRIGLNRLNWFRSRFDRIFWLRFWFIRGRVCALLNYGVVDKGRFIVANELKTKMSHSRFPLRIVCHRESEGFTVVSRLQIGGKPRSVTAHQISSRGGHFHFYGLCMIIGTPLCRSKTDLGVAFAELRHNGHTLTQHAHIIFRGRTQNYSIPHTLRT